MDGDPLSRQWVSGFACNIQSAYARLMSGHSAITRAGGGNQSSRVVLCHASADEEWARAACRALEAADCRCWLASRDCAGGLSGDDERARALDAAFACVLVLSDASLQDPVVTRELERSASKGVPHFVLRVSEQAALPRSVESALVSARWVDATRPPRESRLTELTAAVKAVSPTEPPQRPPLTPLDRIGPYRMLSMIGEGGFGEVWLAERREPMVQRVAIKLIKPGMDSRAVIARFEQERQALAVMDHPNVARVLDAGTTSIDSGARPYFVMEYVKGEPITQFCGRSRVPLRQRLELFIDACHAIQHAHHKGIIHRDIKPSNVLVSRLDSSEAQLHPAGDTSQRALVKIIDFGVAKALIPVLAAGTLFTERGGMIGTPEYMSPEQAGGEADIDTRTDVYSLGVLLYELLTGCLPFDSRALRGGGYAEMQRVIREVEPPAPSQRLRELAVLPAASLHRVTAESTAETISILRRELDWIPLKAMRKGRDQRYSSPEALAADVRRFLDGLPLSAGPESATYRLGKFVRRNRTATVAAAVVMVAVVLGIGGVAWQYARAERARQRAETINSFLRQMFQSSDAIQGGRDHTTVADAIAAGLNSGALDLLRGDPLALAGVQAVLGEILDNNGQAEKGRVLLSEALATRRRLLPAGDPAIAETCYSLSRATRHADRPGESVELFRRTLADCDAVGRKADGTASNACDDLAEALTETGEFEEADRLAHRALELRARLGGTATAPYAQSLRVLAMVTQHKGELAKAESLLEQSVEILRSVSSQDSPTLAGTTGDLAWVYSNQGKHQQAVRTQREALAMFRRIYRGDHPDTAGCMDNLATILRATGDRGVLAESCTLSQDAIAMRERVSGEVHQALGGYCNNLAMTLTAMGRLDEAEKLYGRALSIKRRVYSGSHPDVALSINNLADVRLRLGRTDEAETLFREAADQFASFKGDQRTMLAITRFNVAECLAVRERYAEAAPMYTAAVDLYRQAVPDDDVNSATFAVSLARCTLMLETGPSAREAVRSARAQFERLVPAPSETLALALSTEARVLAVEGDTDRARSLLERAEQMIAEIEGPAGGTTSRLIARDRTAIIAR